MFRTISPEQAGISSKYIEQFIRTLNKRGLATHSFLLMRGNDIFAEYYWKPFHKDFCHRMYSQTKSYVGIAIGLLEQEGKLKLTDRICDHFPDKIDGEIPECLAMQTIQDMLTMQTCGSPPDWFPHSDPDRTHLYLNENPARSYPGMRWRYDSAGSQVLASLVDKLAGKPMFDYMYERIFSKLGTFKTATILQTKNGDSWGDSALLCTIRDMASFARFVMNYGKWNGEQILNEDYVRTATSPVVDNDLMGFPYQEAQGYGYQIWTLGEDGFFFNGMGSQMTYCFPKKDLIFTITSDNQGYAEAKAMIYTALMDIIVDNLQDVPLPEDLHAQESCRKLGNRLELQHLTGHKHTNFPKTINGKTYICEENIAGIAKFSLHFYDDDTGELHYTNAQGDKVLPFGINKNVFGKFPQEGYSLLRGGLRNEEGYLYDCAASAAWREEQKMQLKVQIIDKYFGNFIASFCFKEDRAVVSMIRTAENFLTEYRGIFNAKQNKELST